MSRFRGRVYLITLETTLSPRRLQARDLLVRVDRSRTGPVGRQLEEQLRCAVRSGSLSAGVFLPSTRALAEDLGVSRGVVVRAYAQLAAEGYLDLRQGANPRVRGVAQTRPRQALRSKSENGPKVRFDLRAHMPEVGAFPRQLWLRSLRDTLTTATNVEMGYVDERGLWQLRVEVSNYLGRARGVVADPDLIVITTGASHAVSLIARALLRQGSTRLAVENPGHRVFRAVVEQTGQVVVPVPVDAEGLRVDMLDDAHAVLVSPAHQFPTGVVLSPERRAALVGWARSKGRLVLEDDYDAEFRYDRPPIGALQGLSPEHVAYIGSTAKTLAPALRLGWVALPAKMVDPVANEVANSMLQVSGIDQLAFADFLRRGEFDRHMRRMRAVYRRRRDVVIAALNAELPELRVSGSSAGLHVVLELPSPELEAEVGKYARAAGVLAQSLSEHTLPGYDGPAGVLVGFGSVPEPTLPDAIAELARAVRAAYVTAGRGNGARS